MYEIPEQKKLNLLKLRLSIIGTVTFIIGVSTLAFTILLTLAGAFNVYMIVFFVVAFNIIQWLFAPALIERAYHVKEVSPSERPDLHRMIDSICQKTRMQKPKVMLANIPLANAFAYGSPRYGRRVAVTTGLLNSLEAEEVEAVLGHEIGHLKHRDVQVMMFASVLPAIFYYIGFTFMLSGWFGGNRRDNGGAVLIGLAAMALYWVLSLFVLSLSRLREYYADRHAVETVDDGGRKLSEALAKIANSDARTMRATRGGRSANSFKTLFINDPDTSKSDASLLLKPGRHLSDQELVNRMLSKKVTGFDRFMEIFSTHPNMVKRLRVLRNLR
jgi:heat shock protein HtpX